MKSTPRAQTSTAHNLRSVKQSVQAWNCFANCPHIHESFMKVDEKRRFIKKITHPGVKGTGVDFIHYFRSWCKRNIDKPRDAFEVHIMYISSKNESLGYLQQCLSWIHWKFPFLVKNEMGENCIWSYAKAVQTLSIAFVIRNQHIATKYIRIEQTLLSAFPLS